MNEELKSKPFRLVVREGFDLERELQAFAANFAAIEIDDMVTGGHKRLARQAEHAREQIAAERLERESRAVLEKLLIGSRSLWSIVETHQHDESSSDEVLAVFSSEKAANAALALLPGIPNLSVSELPFAYAYA